ncbi:MAG TPA: Rossmann-like and DUF2520 domain-containing protein [Thermoanaerobaculia bacterium]
MTSPPLADLTFSLIGPGRVGSSLAAWLAAAGARGISVLGRPLEPAGLATGGQDLLLLAVPDAALPELAAVLAARPQARVVLHTAGGLDAEVLAPLRGPAGSAGSAVGTFHPLKAFPRALTDPREAQGVFFALGGDPEAIALGERLATALGAEAGEVPAAARPLYHFAASVAAGGVTTLLAAAAEIADRLGLPPAVARGYLELARGAIAQALAVGDAAAALTGPAARGDVATVEKHLTELARLAPEKLPLALELARETLRQVARRGPLSAEQEALLAALEEKIAGL